MMIHYIAEYNIFKNSVLKNGKPMPKHLTFTTLWD